MKTIIMTLLAVVTLSAASLAQMDAPKPAPELKKVDMFAGSWTLDGDMKASDMGPGGKMTETEKCEWMDGNFFLVCHEQYSIATVSGTATSYMGYSADDKAYTYREFSSMGEFTDSKGTLDGDTLTWLNDEKMGAMTMKGRFTMKITSPTTYNFKFEMSQDGTKWMTVMDGKATKK
jgi:hypothetical protein